MLKKRIIFTLLYDNGHFMLSRNFRLQKVGDFEWLQRNYNFSHIAFYIDELLVLDVSRTNRDRVKFCETLQALTENCFVPISAGGGIQNVDDARQLLLSGADKIVINTALFQMPELVIDLAKEYGQQCIIGSVDVKRLDSFKYDIFIKNGSLQLNSNPKNAIANLPIEAVGELYLNSMDRDGTGQGYDFGLLKLLPEGWSNPVILAGGAGNGNHLIEGLKNPAVDAVATAHLYNFVGDGLKNAREKVLVSNIELASWPEIEEFVKIS